VLTKRLAAAVVAIALVAGALWLRSRRDSDGAASAPANTSTTSAPEKSTLVCIPELADGCRAAAATSGATLTIEPAGATIDRLAKAEAPGPVAWATLSPLPELVDDLRARAGLAPLFNTGQSTALASSKLAVVGRTAQSEVLAAHCGGEVTWACLGEVAGKPWTSIGGQAGWGDVKPAHEAPDTSASGLLTFANATVGFFGRNDIATIDLQSDAYSDWVRRLERSIPYFGGPEGTPFERFLLLPEINVVGTTEAEVNAKAGARKAGLNVAYPAPMAQADAVMVSSAGAPPNGAAQAAQALQANGWSAPSAAPQGGLPAPGVLQALRLLWQDVVR
jgi:hypothetical protein